MPAADPAERSLIGRIAAAESWANTPDRSARTAPGRAAMLAKFEQQVDPDERLDPAERARRAAYKRTAHFQRLALRSAQARRKAKEHSTRGDQTEVVDRPAGPGAP